MAIKFGRPLERSRFAPAPAETKAEWLDLSVRPRRNRKSEWSRRMVRENVLTADDLIWPLFIVDGTHVRAPVESMPDVERLSVDEAIRAAERAAALAGMRVGRQPEPAARVEQAVQAEIPPAIRRRPSTAVPLARSSTMRDRLPTA